LAEINNMPDEIIDLILDFLFKGTELKHRYTYQDELHTWNGCPWKHCHCFHFRWSEGHYPPQFGFMFSNKRFLRIVFAALLKHAQVRRDEDLYNWCQAITSRPFRIPQSFQWVRNVRSLVVNYNSGEYALRKDRMLHFCDYVLPLAEHLQCLRIDWGAASRHEYRGSTIIDSGTNELTQKHLDEVQRHWKLALGILPDDKTGMKALVQHWEMEGRPFRLLTKFHINFGRAHFPPLTFRGLENVSFFFVTDLATHTMRITSETAEKEAQVINLAAMEDRANKGIAMMEDIE
jgi:hypothetical protein